MSRKLLTAMTLVALFALSLPVVAADAPTAAMPENPTVEPVDPGVENKAPAEPAAEKSVESAVADGLTPDWMKPAEAACSCRDQCRRDRDCRRVCGSLGGECVLVNSCCTECGCFG